jgi:hypothetical protein
MAMNKDNLPTEPFGADVQEFETRDIYLAQNSEGCDTDPENLSIWFSLTKVDDNLYMVEIV